MGKCSPVQETIDNYVPIGGANLFDHGRWILFARFVENYDI